LIKKFLHAVTRSTLVRRHGTGGWRHGTLGAADPNVHSAHAGGNAARSI